MTDCNPYESPKLGLEEHAALDWMPGASRILWTAGCAAIGAGLSWGLPILLIYLGLWNGGGGQGALAGWFILVVCSFASILSGFVGFAFGASRPGRYAILATIACVVLTDIIALAFCFAGDRYDSSNHQFVLLYLVSAVTKLAGVKLLVPRNAILLNRLVIFTGAILLLCIVVWMAR